MKKLALFLILFLGAVLYSLHEKSVRQARELAADEVRAAAQAEAQATLAKEREARRTAEIERERQERDRESARLAREEAERAAALQRPAMAVSRVVEPLLTSVMAPLNLAQPADIVPVIEVTKQRILDKEGHAEPGRKPVYQRATALMNYLISVAEERTKSLEAMLKNRLTSVSSIDRPKGPSSGDFFNQNVSKRWEDTMARARPALAQLLDQLRAAERDWNRQLDRDTAPETYDVMGLAPILIPDQTASGSALDSPIKNGTTTRPWRNGYYSTYGYRYPTYVP